MVARCRNARTRPEDPAAVRLVADAAGALASVPPTPGTVNGLAEIIGHLGAIVARHPSVLPAVSSGVRAILLAAVNGVPGAPGGDAPDEVTPIAALATAVRTLGDAPTDRTACLPLTVSDALAVARRACTAVAARGRTRGVSEGSMGPAAATPALGPDDVPELDLIGTMTAHALCCDGARARGALGSEVSECLALVTSAVSRAEADAIVSQSNAPPVRYRVFLETSAISALAGLLGTTAGADAEAVRAGVALVSSVAVSTVRKLDNSRAGDASREGNWGTVAACARALATLSHACVRVGLDVIQVRSELRRVLSDAASVVGPDQVPQRGPGLGLAAGYATDDDKWEWLRVLHPSGASLLAAGGWCGISSPGPLASSPAAAWGALRAILDALSVVVAIGSAGKPEAAGASLLTVTVALADVSGQGRSGWEALAWGGVLAAAGRDLAQRGSDAAIVGSAGILLDALPQVDRLPQSEDLAAASFALCSLVGSCVERMASADDATANAVAAAEGLLDKTLDALRTAFLDVRVGAARRGVAVGLAHLAYVTSGLGGRWAERTSSATTQLLQDACWDGEVSLPGVRGRQPVIALSQRGLSGRPVDRDDVVSLLPSLSLAVGGWLGGARAMASPDGSDADDLVDSLRRLTVLAANPRSYQDAIEVLGQEGVAQLVRQLQLVWLCLALVRAEDGLAGATGRDLGLSALAFATPPLVLHLGYQRDEARMDVVVLLERMFGVTPLPALASALVALRMTHATSSFAAKECRAALKQMDPRDVAALVSLDALSAARAQGITGGGAGHGPSIGHGPTMIELCFAQLHLADRTEVPVVASVLRRAVGVFSEALESVGTSYAPLTTSTGEAIRRAAKDAALLYISQLEGSGSSVASGELTTAPPPQQSAVAVARGAADDAAQVALRELLRVYPAVLYSQSCLGALMQMGVAIEARRRRGIRALMLRGLEKASHKQTKAARSKMSRIREKLGTKLGTSRSAQLLLDEWVQRSAHFAPSALEASVHQMIMESSHGALVENAEVMSRAGRVLEMCTSARRSAASISPARVLSGASTSASSFTDLHAKVMYLGRAMGRLDETARAFPADGRSGALSRLVSQACHALEAGGLDDTKDSVMDIAAALALCHVANVHGTKHASVSSEPLGLPGEVIVRAVRLVVQAPMDRLTVPDVLAGSAAWSWISSVLPRETEADIVVEVCQGLCRSAFEARGMFAHEDEDANPDAIAGDDGVNGNTQNEVRAQQACMSFLMEHLGIHYRETSAAAEAVRIAIITACSTCVPYLASRLVGGLSSRPSVTVHARLQLCFIYVEAIKAQRPALSSSVDVLGTASALRLAARAGVAVLAESTEPWCGKWTSDEAAAQLAIVLQLADAMTSVPLSPSVRPDDAPQDGAVRSVIAAADRECRLLVLLCRLEADRLRIWSHPTGGRIETKAAEELARRMVIKPETAVEVVLSRVPASDIAAHVDTAWHLSPKLVIRLILLYPGESAIVDRVLHHIRNDACTGWSALCTVPIVAPLILRVQREMGLSDASLEDLFELLPPGNLSDAMQMLAVGGAKLYVREYAVRCLKAQKPENILFYVSQMVQTLRFETGNSSDSGADAARGRSARPVTDFLLESSRASAVFAHRIFWLLRSEGRPPAEAMNPEIKRSGWEPPEDSGLWDIADRVRGELVASLSDEGRAYLGREDGFFAAVNETSEKMGAVVPTMRKAKLAEMLAEINEQFSSELSDTDRALASTGSTGPSRLLPLYMPIQPSLKVVRAVPGKGNVMPSAAKFPVMAFFDTVDVARHRALEAAGGDVSLACGQRAYIFKVGDDVRQDVLALQVIEILANAFKSAGLSSYLFPYGTIPTGYEQGIIEVVPSCQSRSAMGDVNDGGLFDIFMREFGAPGSPAFEQARQNFIVSSAGYAVATYIIQAKDRHNGNLLITRDGHLVHIDFGFILEISPGGNLGFETAGFKMSHDMTQLIDPGRKKKSPLFAQFLDLCVKGYLVARSRAEDIIAVVGLMQDSQLPCFGHGKPMENLRKRFRLDLSNRDAATFFRGVVFDAYDKPTTKYYDVIQQLQNGYPH